MAEISSYFPDVIKEVREFKQLAVTENPELELLYTNIESVLNDQFLETAAEYGVARCEKIVGITPKATDTLDERKFKVLTKYNEDMPYTVRKFHELLTTLCGKDGYELVINNNEFSLLVKVALVSKKNETAVRDLVERITPVNMVLEVTLMYNQHSKLKPMTHAELSKYRHCDIREEVF